MSLFSPTESVDNCPSNCYGNGDCISGTCHCFLGFLGPDCGRGERPAPPREPAGPHSWGKGRNRGQLLPLGRRARRGQSCGALQGGLQAEPCPGHVIHGACPGRSGGKGGHREPVSIVGARAVATGSFAKVDFPLEDRSAFAERL